MPSPMEKTILKRVLSIEHGQIVFQALSELPFKYVYDLIGRINQVTNTTDPIIREGSVCYSYTFAPQEMELILHALGRLPYAKVHEVIRALEEEGDHGTPS